MIEFLGIVIGYAGGAFLTVWAIIYFENLAKKKRERNERAEEVR